MNTPYVTKVTVEVSTRLGKIRDVYIFYIFRIPESER